MALKAYKIPKVLPCLYRYATKRQLFLDTPRGRDESERTILRKETDTGDITDKPPGLPPTVSTERHKISRTTSIEDPAASQIFKLKFKEPNDELFKNAYSSQPNKEGFSRAIDTFISKDRQRRGHLSFIYTAMKYMKKFDVEENLSIYNELLDVFPKGKFHNTSFLDILVPRSDPHVDCALDLLTLMEDNGIRPDDMTYTILMEVFGKKTLPIQKYKRLVYWFDRFENINPYKLPKEIYQDKFELCKIALTRISNNQELVKTYICDKTADPLNNVEEKSFLVSVQNTEFTKNSDKLTNLKSLYVEGPFTLWMFRTKETYFVLKTGHSALASNEDIYNDNNVNEGVILAICMTNLPVPDSLRKWINYLQDDIPMLKNFDIIFDLKVTNSTDSETDI